MNGSQPSPEIEVINIPIRNPYLPEHAQSPPIFKLEVPGSLLKSEQGSLCRVCLTFASLLEQLNTQASLAGHVRSGARFGHHESLDNLKAAAANGCPFCQMLPQHLESVQHGYSWFQEFHWKIPNGEIRIYQDWLSSLDDRTRMHWTTGGDRSPAQRDLQFVPLPDAVGETIKIARYHEMQQAWETANMTFAEHWLEDCLTHHAGCTHYARVDAPRPKRLVDVTERSSDGESDVHLHLSSEEDESAPYIALSHRWGDHQPLRLLQDTLDAMRESLSFQALSPTYQDAVRLARTFGVKFLWIDSLCIIQDSPTDWQTESAKMSNVYRGALFTIAATAAEAENGIIVKNSRSDQYPVSLGIKIDEGVFGQSGGTLHARIKEETDGDANVFLERFFNYGPLDSRAWVLQEKVLSTRTLSFTKMQLRWECLENEYTTSKPEGLEKSVRVQDEVQDGNEDQDEDEDPLKLSEHKLEREIRIESTATDRIPEASITHLQQKLTKQTNLKRRRTDYIETFKQGISGIISILNNQSAAEEFHFAWYLLVENYTRRNLTYETDRFAAIASLVSTMQQASGDKCLAGIWKQHIWRDLLWTTTKYSHWELPEGDPCRRSEYLKGPSWSWLSVVGYINYSVNEFDCFDDHRNLLIDSPTIVLRNEESHFHAHDVGGELFLHGFVATAVFQGESFLEPDTSKVLGTYSSDVGGEEETPLQATCIAISHFKHVFGGMGAHNESVYALVLVPKSDSRYERVGLAKWDVQAWEECDKREAKLVVA